MAELIKKQSLENWSLVQAETKQRGVNNLTKWSLAAVKDLDLTGFLLGSKTIGYPATNNKTKVIKIYSCYLATNTNSKDRTNYFGPQH